MFDLVPWKPLPLPLSDHLQVSGWVSVRRRVLLQSPSYGLTQLTFQRKELSFHPCVCQTRPQPIPPRVCWEVGKDQCHGSDLSIALNALHFAIPPSKRAASGSAADGWHKKKEIHCDQPKFSAKKENDFWSPFSPLQLGEHENMWHVFFPAREVWLYLVLVYPQVMATLAGTVHIDISMFLACAGAVQVAHLHLPLQLDTCGDAMIKKIQELAAASE